MEVKRLKEVNVQYDCLECARVYCPIPYFSIPPAINYAAVSDHPKLFSFLCSPTNVDFRIIIFYYWPGQIAYTVIMIILYELNIRKKLFLFKCDIRTIVIQNQKLNTIIERINVYNL